MRKLSILFSCLCLLFATSSYSIAQSSNWTKTVLPDTVIITSLSAIGHTVLASTTIGMYRSTDDGDTWALADTALVMAQCVTVTRNGMSMLAAFSTNSNKNQLFYSDDSGMSWHSWGVVSSGSPVNGVTLIGTTLFASTGESGVFRSTNEGVTWDSVGYQSLLYQQGFLDIPANSITSMDSILILASWYCWFYISSDNGETWEHVPVETVCVGITGFFNSRDKLEAETALGSIYSMNGTPTLWQSVTPVLDSCGPGMFSANDAAMYFATICGVYRSFLDGKPWVCIDSTIPLLSPSAMTVTNDRVILSDNHTIYVRSLPTEAVAESPVLEQDLRIFPQPASTSATLRFALDAPSKVSANVFDVLGRLQLSVAERELQRGANELTLLLGSLRSGLYSCVIHTASEDRYSRIVVQH